MRNQHVLAGLLAWSLCTGAFAAGSAPSRLAEQNALFDQQYEADLEAHPERATAFGDYRYNDRLDDVSLSAINAQHEQDQSFLKRLNAISTSGFAEQDVMSHQVMARVLEQRISDYDFKEYEMPVNQMSGPHTHLADLALAVPLDTVEQYEDYISRLHQIPRTFAQTEETLKAGKNDGLMPVRFLLEKVPAQCLGVIAADPFVLPTRKYPASIPLEEQRRLTRVITETVVNEVLPSYLSFASFISEQYAPFGRPALSVASLPGGEKRYLNDIRSRTTLSKVTPDRIHQIGLHEIERIQGEMLAVAHKAGFADLDSFRAATKSNPQYHPASADAIVTDFRKYILQMQPKLPQLFGFVPAAPVTVEPMPDFEPGNATHYQTGTPDGKRPGRVVVAVANVEHRSLIDDEATAYHEGVPGHHMQLSVAQTLPSLPQFRKHGGNSGYVEGWALYAEQLGKEVGFYQDPVSDYGRLSSELFRAVRLVVDTGIHSKGWTRDQVIDFFRKTDAVDEPTLQAETDRYIAWPAQALAYKLGQLKFRELRERASKQLGSKFDLKAFHDEMLNGGVLPLDLLDSRTNAWIKAQQKKPVAVAAN